MVLQNKSGIDNPAELARMEEKISKTKAMELYGSMIIEQIKSKLKRGVQMGATQFILN